MLKSEIIDYTVLYCYTFKLENPPISEPFLDAGEKSEIHPKSWPPVMPLYRFTKKCRWIKIVPPQYLTTSV